MKAADKRRGPDNKERNRPARIDLRDRKLQVKNGGRNLKVKEIDSKPISDQPNAKTLASDLKTGVVAPEIHENMVTDYVEGAYRSEGLLDTRTVQTDVKLGNRNFNDTSSVMEIADESDAETTYDSVSSQGDSHTADEEKTEILESKSDRKTNSPQIKASKSTCRKGDKSKKGISKLTTKSSSDNLKNMKVHPKPLSDSSEGADRQPRELHEGINIPDDTSDWFLSVSTDDGVVNSKDNDDQQEQAALDQKIEKMEARIQNLENELREVAALEIALYSVVPEHGSSAHKVHAPARRLSRIYIYACKHWSQDRRATVARNTVSGLVLVSKSCSNDVSRLTFWLSNTVVLREIISQAFASSCKSSSRAIVYESNEGETKPSAFTWKNANGGRKMKEGLLQFVDDWQETKTFTSALEKVESWIFLRIVESIWWQTLTPNMQSPADPSTSKGTKKPLGPALGDQEQGNFSINLWKNAFHDALKRLCPVRAGGHECGCLPVLARKVMEQCIGRLDVAIFNAILRESAHEIPTDPVSDPILDSKVLPIPAGYLSFGSGAQLKNAVGNWARWLSDFLGMDADGSAEDEDKSQEDSNNSGTKEPQIFPLLNTLSDLLMLPKDMLKDSTIRTEVCPSISLPLVKRILCNFSPDEFCPDPVPGSVLEALNAECLIEHRLSGEFNNNNFPHTAAPVVYTPPCSSEVAEKVVDAGSHSTKFSRSASTVQRKGYTSDEELDELESCLASVVNILPLSPTDIGNGKEREAETGYDGGNARYELLREVWKAS